MNDGQQRKPLNHLPALAKTIEAPLPAKASNSKTSLKNRLRSLSPFCFLSFLVWTFSNKKELIGVATSLERNVGINNPNSKGYPPKNTSTRRATIDIFNIKSNYIYISCCAIKDHNK